MTEQIPADGVKVQDLFSKDPEELLKDRPAVERIVEYLREQRQKFAEIDTADQKKGRKKSPKKALDLDKKAKEI